MSLTDLLINGAKELGVKLSDKQLELFMKFLDNLNSWNKQINLTAIKDEREIIVNHFLDSLSIASDIEDNKRLLDIGTGGGFPGIPLKIVRPGLHVTLLDSNNKKISFLKDTVRKLALKNTKAVWGRAEDAQNGLPRGHYDYVVSRAVGSIHDMVNLSSSYVSSEGHIVLMRGKKGREEWLHESEIIEDKYHIVDYREFELPYSDSFRTVIVLKPKTQR